MKLGNWKVCKSTVGKWDNLWNWTVLYNGKCVDMFDTKIRDKESLVEDGIANLHEEEALRIHEAEKGVA